MFVSPHDRDAPSPLDGDSSLGAVIEAFLRATDPLAEQRQLRAALSHVGAELGSLPVRAVGARHYERLLDDLRRAGISPRREDALVGALHSLYGFAVARGLVFADPLRHGAIAPRARPRGPSIPTHAPEPAPARTPTLTMLALGARVAYWTTGMIMLVFVGLLLVLVVELA